MKKLIIIISFLSFILNISAQTEALDTIYTRKGSEITGKVKEIGSAEVKYIQPQINPDVIYIINPNEIEKIVFYNGNVQKFELSANKIETIEQNSEALFQLQKKKALKIDFLSVVANTLTFTYEQCLKPGRSVEFSAGYIGIGTGLNEDNASGILFRGGYKLAKNPDYYLKGMRYSHILKGAYIKPEFNFASYNFNKSNDYYNQTGKVNNTKWAFLLVFGNQWIFSDNFLIDVYSGYGLGGNSLDDSVSSYPYGFAIASKDFSLGMSFGVRMGFLLK